MGQKAYLRYEFADSFGVIASSLSNIVSVPNSDIVLSPALEYVHIYDFRNSELKGFFIIIFAFIWVIIIIIITMSI
jgi:hypothetical protein